jgi:hypothetical protein
MQQQQHQEASALAGSSQAGACRILFCTRRRIFWTGGWTLDCKARIGRARLSWQARVSDWSISALFLSSLSDWSALKPVLPQYLFYARLIT